MARNALDRLRKAGCRVGEFGAPRRYALEEVNYRTHRTIPVIDGAVAFTGGLVDRAGREALDNRSLELNDELNVGVSDRDFARRLLDDFNADLKSARRLELDAWQRRSVFEKAREYFWSYFGEVF